MIAVRREAGPSARSCNIPEAWPDDQELVGRMRRGDRNAFDQFFETYAPRVARFAARRSALDAAALEDIVQNTMIKAMRGLGGFRGDASLFSWLCRICRSQLADVQRKSARQPKTVSLEPFVSAGSFDNPAAWVDQRDPLDACDSDSTRSVVRQVVNQLPASHARILELRFGEELTLPQIARLLQISESAAESRLVRARQAFRDLLSATVGTHSLM